MKICSTCKQEKPNNKFSKTPAHSSGLKSGCKECNNKQRRERYRKWSAKQPKTHLPSVMACKTLGCENPSPVRGMSKRNGKTLYETYCRECIELKRSETSTQQKRDYQRLRAKQLRDKLRKEILDGYGNKCAHCKSPDVRVLSIDHVNNDGIKDRQISTSPYVLYKKIVKANFPSNYQLLCRNCNWLKHLKHSHPSLYVS